MIAKRVHRVKGGSFRRLGGYIARLEASKWQRTADYILDTLGASRRALGIRITNCQAEELEDALAEITATQMRNRRARGERTYHMVVSFAEGERPLPEQLRDIEDELCAAIGLGAHQRLSAIHTDTAHLHIHVAINQIHPQTLALIEPWYDKAKLMAACERLEIKHGLQRTSHGESRQNVGGRAGDAEAHSGEASFAGWIGREVLPSLLGVLEAGGDWPALHRALAAHGLVIRQRGAGLIIAEANGRWRVKASGIDRRLSHRSLSERFGAFQPAAKADRATPQKSAYRQQPLPTDSGLRDLYLAYQRERPEAIARRLAAFRACYEDDAKRRRELRHWSEDAVCRIRRQDGLMRQARRLALAKHRAEAAALEQKLREQSRRDWQALRALHPPFAWQAFLQKAARQGHAEAALALQRREGRFLRAIAVVQAGTAWIENPVVEKQFRPQSEDSQVSYRTGDGGRIVDCGKIVDLPGDTREAVLLAFSILTSRFPGEPITLKGDDAFIAKAIQIAAAEKPEIRFADPAHEAERRRLCPPALQDQPKRARAAP